VALVRYIVKDVEKAADFYTRYLDFKLERRNGDVLAIVSREDIQLWLIGPTASGARPVADGRKPEPGGWNRIVVTVQGLDPFLAKMKDRAITFRDEVSTGPTGRSLLVEDPSGNLVEIFEPG
jgi:catechol 2,3-dioxygenase-like lactoylglutathione lyase family enzyme